MLSSRKVVDNKETGWVGLQVGCLSLPQTLAVPRVSECVSFVFMLFTFLDHKDIL